MRKSAAKCSATVNKKARTEPRIEPLEARIAPAVTVNFAAGVLTVTLGAGSDISGISTTDATGHDIQVTGTGFTTASFNSVTKLIVNYAANSQTVTTTSSNSLFNLTSGFLIGSSSGVTGEAFTDSTGGNTFDFSNFVGSGTFNGNATVADTLAVSKAGGFTLTNAKVIDTADSMSLNLTNIAKANLTDPAGGHTIDVSGWTGTGLMQSTGAGTDTITATKAFGFGLSSTGLTATDGMNVTLSKISTANLTDSAGGNTFAIDSTWIGTANLANSKVGGTADTVSISKGAGFTLSNSSITDTADAMTVNLTQTNSGIHTANLTDTTGGHTFTVSGWTFGGTLTNSAVSATADAVTASKAGGFTLSSSSLSDTADTMSLNLAQTGSGIHTANLTDSVGGGNTFIVTNWTFTANLTNSGTADVIQASKLGGFTLTNTSLSDTADAMQVNYASGAIKTANLTDGSAAGGNTFNLGTGSGAWAFTASLVNNGSGADTLTIAKATGFTLTNTALTDTADSMSVTFAAGAIQTANLTDTGGSHTFIVSGWTHNATLTNSGANGDVVSASKGAGFTLSNGALTDSADTMNITLAATSAGITSASLTDTAGGNTFDVGGWTHAVTLAVSTGSDTIAASKAGGFTLTNTSLTDTADGLNATFTSGAIQTANLTDTAGGHTFTVSSWTHGGTLKNSGANVDTIAATKGGGFTLSDSSLTDTADAMNITFAATSAGIHNAQLTDSSGGGKTFIVSGWTGTGTLAEIGGPLAQDLLPPGEAIAGDTVTASKTGGFTLTNTSITDTADTMDLTWTAGTIIVANLTDSSAAGGNTFNFGDANSGWQHTANLTVTNGADTVASAKAGGFTLTNTKLTDTADLMQVNYISGAIQTADLTDTAGGKIFIVSGWSFGGTLVNSGSTGDTISATKAGGFTLTSTSIKDSADTMNLLLSATPGGFTQALLTDNSSGGNTFDVGGWKSSVSLTNQGGTPDTIAVSKAAGFTLTDTSLTDTADGLDATYAAGSIQTANLTDTGGGNTFNVDDWTYGGTFTNSGGSDDTISATKAGGFTLSDGSLVDTADTMDIKFAATAAGIHNATLTDSSQAGGNTFDVGGWTGTVSLSKTGALPDKIAASKAAGFTLKDTSLTDSVDGLDATFASGAIQTANLTDTAGGHTFDFGDAASGWTYLANLTVGTGSDTITSSKAAGFTLTDTELTDSADGMQVKYTAGQIQQANLTDAGGGNTFNVDGWSHNATLTNTGAPQDTIDATKPGGFTLTDASLTDSADGMDITLSLLADGIHAASLTDSSAGGGNTFDVGGWTGPVTLVVKNIGSGAAADTIAATKAAGFTLTDTSLTDTADGLDATYAAASIQNAKLTDTGGGNTFLVSNWTYLGTLTNSGATTDAITASKSAGFTLTDSSLKLTGTSDGLNLTLIQTGGGIHIANLTDSSGGHVFDFGGDTGGWSFTANLTVNGPADTITVAKAGGFTLTNTELTDTADGMDVKYVSGAIQTANLTDTTGGHTFDFGGASGGWGHLVNLTVNTGSDTIAASKSGGFTLSDTELTDSGDAMDVKYTAGQIDDALLTDVGGGNTFTVSNWSHEATLTNSGAATDAITVSKPAGFTLTDSSLTLTGTSDGLDLTLVQTGGGIHTANLTDSSGGHVFDFGGATGGWSFTANLTVNGAADTINVAKAGGYTLKDTELTDSADAMDVKYASGAIQTANLTDTTGGHTFDFGGVAGGWTYLANLTVNAGSDAITVAKAGGFTLNSTELTDSADTMDVKYASGSIRTANLTDTTGGHTFNITGWLYAGSLISQGLSDTVNYTDTILPGEVGTSTGSIGVVLTDSLLYSTNGMDLTLTNLHTAQITAGSVTTAGLNGNEVLDASKYTGNLTLTGSDRGLGIGERNDALKNNDVLIAGHGVNTLIGGLLADRFVLNGLSMSDTLTPSLASLADATNPKVNQSKTTQRDLIDYSAATDGLVINMGLTSGQHVNSNSSLTNILTLTAAFDDLLGSTFNDKLTGDSVTNIIYGGGGKDTLAGGGVLPHLAGKPANHDYLLGTKGTKFLPPKKGTQEIDSKFIIKPKNAPFASIIPILVPEVIFNQVTPDPYVIAETQEFILL